MHQVADVASAHLKYCELGDIVYYLKLTEVSRLKKPSGGRPQSSRGDMERTASIPLCKGSGFILGHTQYNDIYVWGRPYDTF